MEMKICNSFFDLNINYNLFFFEEPDKENGVVIILILLRNATK